MYRLTLILLLSISGITAEEKDPYAKKGPGWKSWEKFYKAVIAHDLDVVKKLVSGKIAKEFPFDRIDRIADEFRQNQMTFIREFDGKNKKFRYLVVSVKGKSLTLILKKGEKLLTFDDTAEQDLRGPDDAINEMQRHKAKAKLAKIKSKLKQIGTTYAMFFTDGLNNIIPTPQAVEVDSSIMTYIHPESGKEGQFLFIQPGYKYSGSSELVIATTDKPIFGKYQAVFEDGHVEGITVEQFKKHSLVLGLKRQKITYKELSAELQKEILTFIEQLGADKFKQRKAAKNALLGKGQQIVGFLEKHRNHSDFEVKVSIGEIIDKLEPQGPSAKRPNIR